MKKYLFLLPLVFLSSSVFSEVSFFSFTTKSQVVSPDTLSPPITFQSQNSIGQKETITETFDIVFIDGLHLCEQVLRDVNNSIK